MVNRPAVERRLNDIFWLLSNRKKWTSNSPEWQPGRSIKIEIQPSLMTPQLLQFAKYCPYWAPTISAFPTTVPKIPKIAKTPAS